MTDDGPFRRVRPGDTVIRLVGDVPVPLRVTAVDERFIYCGPPTSGWKFDKSTGVEVDEELGWGPDLGVSGSWLLAVGGIEGRADAAALHAFWEWSAPLAAPNQVTFRTATGSVYRVKHTTMTWERQLATLASGTLRSEGGRLLRPVVPVEGRSALLVCEPFEDGLGPRLVITSMVVQVERSKGAVIWWQPVREITNSRAGEAPGRPHDRDKA